MLHIKHRSTIHSQSRQTPRTLQDISAPSVLSYSVAIKLTNNCCSWRRKNSSTNDYASRSAGLRPRCSCSICSKEKKKRSLPLFKKTSLTRITMRTATNPNRQHLQNTERRTLAFQLSFLAQTDIRHLASHRRLGCTIDLLAQALSLPLHNRASFPHDT
jgi:hypothetical protein